jgi:hypothetical protein
MLRMFICGNKGKKNDMIQQCWLLACTELVKHSAGQWRVCILELLV